MTNASDLLKSSAPTLLCYSAIADTLPAYVAKDGVVKRAGWLFIGYGVTSRSAP